MRERASQRPDRARAALAVAAVVAAAASGCGRQADPPADAAALPMPSPADLEEESFRSYLRREVGLDPDGVDPEALPRLHRQYLEEVLFARAAERIGLVVPEDRLAAEAARLAEILPDADDRRRLDEARRRLLARAYVEQQLVPRIDVDPDEVDSELDDAAGRKRTKWVVYRQIRVDDENAARQVHRRIVREGDPFDAVARELSTSPDKGALQERDLAALPDVVARVLARLPEGKISNPIRVGDAWYLFELEARNRSAGPLRERERSKLRETLFARKLDALIEAESARLARQEGWSWPEDGTAER